MKNQAYRAVLSLLLVFVASVASAQSDFAPDNAKMRVGEILFQRPKTINFSFKNKGKKAFEVMKVLPSCGCTTVEWTHGSIEPGKTGLITAVYDAKMLGTFYKELAVYVTCSSEPIYLSMEGRVVTDLLDFTGDFPIDLGSLRMNANYLEFDNVNKGDHPVTEFQVVNMERSPYRPELMHLPNYLTFESIPEVIPGGKVGTVRVTLDSEKLGQFGLTQTRIFLSRYPGDKIGEANEILVSSVLLPTLSNLTEEQLQRAPKLILSDENLEFDLAGKPKKTQTIVIVNAGKEPLDISAVQVFNPAVSVSLGKKTILPGENTTLKLTVTAKYLKSGKGRPRVLLISNDPQRAKQQIDINVKP